MNTKLWMNCRKKKRKKNKHIARTSITILDENYSQQRYSYTSNPLAPPPPLLECNVKQQNDVAMKIFGLSTLQNVNIKQIKWSIKMSSQWGKYNQIRDTVNKLEAKLSEWNTEPFEVRRKDLGLASEIAWNFLLRSDLEKAKVEEQ